MSGLPLFVLNSVLLGIGLAMDAFAVSAADGLNDPEMSPRRHLLIAGTFAFFQALMPLLGWVCVHTLFERFTAIQRFIPWIAFALLLWIGIQMIREGKTKQPDSAEAVRLTGGTLIMQGVATSIDALSVGFAIAEYGWHEAVAAALIIAAVTFAICWAGVRIGRSAGTRLSGKASILGGVILILIGAQILLRAYLG